LPDLPIGYKRNFMYQIAHLEAGVRDLLFLDAGDVGRRLASAPP